MPKATPAGVPVATTSPGNKVMKRLMYATSCRTEHIMSPVQLFCRSSPFTLHHSRSFCGSVTSSPVTNHGPIGAKLSALLPLVH